MHKITVEKKKYTLKIIRTTDVQRGETISLGTVLNDKRKHNGIATIVKAGYHGYGRRSRSLI